MSGVGPVVAVVVGVSAYRDPAISPLPGAASDARRFAQALVNWGYPAANVNLILSGDATRAAVLNALRVWARDAVFPHYPSKFVFFFAGHGRRVRDKDGGDEQSILLPADSDPADFVGTGLPLQEVVKGLANKVRAEESFLFMDACGLRLDRVHDAVIQPLPESTVFPLSGRRGVHAVFAAGPHSAIEDGSLDRGYFTTALLQALSVMRSSPSNTLELANVVNSCLDRANCPVPEHFLVGQPGWPLPGVLVDDGQVPAEIGARSPELVSRSRARALLQDALARADGRPVWLFGEAGRGKTVLVREFVVMSGQSSVYASAADEGQPVDLTDPLTSIVAAIGAARPHVRLPHLLGPHRFSEVVGLLAKAEPGAVLVVDHLDRLPSGVLSDLARSLSEPTSLQIILVCRTPPDSNWNVVPIDCPPLDDADIARFRTTYGPAVAADVRWLRNVSGGNALRLRQLLASPDLDLSDLLERDRAFASDLAIVRTASGFLDALAFSEATGTAPESIALAERIGLLLATPEGFSIHDVARTLDLPQVSASDLGRILQYWATEVMGRPRMLEPARRYLALFARVPRSEWLPDVMELALGTCARRQDWSTIEGAVTFIIGQEGAIPKAVIPACAALIRVGRYAVAHAISERIADEGITHTTASAAVVLQEKAWWSGEFAHGISLGEQVLQLGDIDLTCRADCHLHLGISLFFLGRWSESMYHCTYAELLARADAERTCAWARLIAGTIIGIRGDDVPEGRRLLRSAARVLDVLEDDVGHGVALGNLGEVEWKAGHWSQAYVTLRQALAIAERGGNSANQLEITRNLIHVAIRTRKDDLQRLLERARALLAPDMDSTEQMQVWNTLATSAAYLGNLDDLDTSLENATRHTTGNAEYEIYTHGNRALRALIAGDDGGAATALAAAVALARAGENWLAVRQVTDDFTVVAARCGRELFASATLTRTLAALGLSVAKLQEHLDGPMTETVIGLSVDSADEATSGILFERLRREVRGLEGVSEAPRSAAEGASRTRLGVVELLATFVTSAAAYRLAVAVHHYAITSKARVRIRRPDGVELLVEGSGDGASEVAKVVAHIRGAIPAEEPGIAGGEPSAELPVRSRDGK